MSEESEIIQRGTQAKEFLDNPLTKDTLTTIEEAIIDQWKVQVSPDAREELWYTLKGLERFKSILEQTVESGDAQVMFKEKFK